MPHLLRVARKHAAFPNDEFPFSVPAIRVLESLDVNVGVTFFVGENGSGKSTLLEGIASAAELSTTDQRVVSNDATLGPQRRLGDALRLSWSPRSRKGFFLRAEDFFGQMKSRARAWAREAREKAGLPDGITDNGMHVDEVSAASFMAGFDTRSHGESFMDLFSTTIKPGGLYLLDEPEAPLSPKRQIVFLGLMEKAAASGAQLIVATHSPILLACRGARIFDFDRAPIAEVAFEDLEHVRTTRDFLNEKCSRGNGS